MCKWYKEMNCYVIASAETVRLNKMDKIEQKALLEHSFRNYAAVFDKVKIVISKSQAKEHYLNFPYIIQDENSTEPNSLQSLADDATSEAIFVGHSAFYDFPISLLANLITSYNGELFMGYKSENQKPNQPLFGIYHTSLFSQKEKLNSFETMIKNSHRLLPLPDSTLHLF